jgi:uncharacterized protein YndB with AHSA1/START domain
MSMSLRCLFVAIILAAIMPAHIVAEANEPDEVPTGAFAFELTAEIPGTPEQVYDALTGDIGGWWDHSMSENPLRMFIEAKPGGGFWEIFDESGDGVRHAVITYAHRGKLLRFEGPLGLAGNAIDMVTTYELAPAGESATLLKVRVHASGEVHAGWPEIVEKTWRHFIFERFVPYMTADRRHQ